MIRFNRPYTYVGNDVNLKNMKCIPKGMYEKGVKVVFKDEFLGRIETFVNPNDLYKGYY